MSAGRALVEYLGGLEMAGGDRDGEPFEVLGWERRFLLGAFRGAGDAALSVARGNGKSALVAGIACAVVDPGGPLHGRRREVVCVASSFQQSRIIFEDVLAMLRARFPELRQTFRIQDSANTATLEHRGTGARVRCIGSDPKRAHGLRPLLVLADEPAQWPPSTGEKMVAALRTGLGKVPGSRLIALGTRPAGSDHWFGRALEGGGGYAQVHAARPDDGPFAMRSIRRANPSWDHLPSLRARVLQEREDARKDVSALQSWKALRLNLGVPDTAESVLVEAAKWLAAEREPEDLPEARGPCCWGVDLGTTAASSAVSAYWPETGRLQSFAAFPEVPGLGERGLADGVGMLYVQMAERGELLTLGRYTADVSALTAEALERYGAPRTIAADRWREGDLREALDKARLPLARLSFRGQGFRDGAEDVRLFRKTLADGKLSPEASLLMRHAMREARVVGDAASNFKLAKKTESGRKANARDDAAAAAILAVAEGARLMRRGVKRPPLRAVRIG